jgi:hypothetical protein
MAIDAGRSWGEDAVCGPPEMRRGALRRDGSHQIELPFGRNSMHQKASGQRCPLKHKFAAKFKPVVAVWKHIFAGRSGFFIGKHAETTSRPRCFSVKTRD